MARKPPTAVDMMKAEALEALVFADNPGAIPTRKPAKKPATRKPATRRPARTPVGERWEDTHQRRTFILPVAVLEGVLDAAEAEGVTASRWVADALAAALGDQ